MVVIGDHGMTETGDHGGDSKAELETTLFFYSKKEIFTKYDNQKHRVNLFESKLKLIDPKITIYYLSSKIKCLKKLDKLT